MENDLNGTAEATGTAEKSYDDHIMDLADILDESDEDTPKEKAKEDANNEGDDPDLEAADFDDENPDDEGDQPDYDKGRFAADAAKVKLDDGSMVTVAELKRGHLREADYTRKTMELSEQRKAFEARESNLSNVEQTLAQQRDFLVSLYQNIIPQEPSISEFDADPLGYMRAKAEYDARVAQLNDIANADMQEKARRQQIGAHNSQIRLAEERERLFQIMPDLKDPARFDAVTRDIAKYGAETYRLTNDELASLADHRFVHVLRDAVSYRKILAKRSETQKTVNDKPRLVQSGRRLDPKAMKSRDVQQRASTLRKTGTLDAGIAALMDLDL